MGSRSLSVDGAIGATGTVVPSAGQARAATAFGALVAGTVRRSRAGLIIVIGSRIDANAAELAWRMSPPAFEGPTFTGITGIQGPTW